MGRSVFVGDVHGCLEELDELVLKLSLSASDRLILIGDLIDRGPDPVGVVRRVRESGWECVLGNHEEKAIRWLKNESLVKSGRPNNMQPPSASRAAEWRRLSPADVGWLWRLPLTLESGGWTAVHAGFEPRRPVQHQDADNMLHVRFAHKDTGKYVPMDPVTMKQPPDTLFWAEMWTGPEKVVYGHSVFDSVRFDQGPDDVRCVGIDTGCVYGGSLTAAVVDGDVLEIVSVPAKKTYFSYGDRRLS